MKFCPFCQNKLLTATIDNKIRLKCSSLSCDYVFWNNPVPVVAAIVEQDGLIVLARNQMWPEDKYALIAGFLEAYESPEEAIIREIKEELNVSGKIISFVGHYPFFEKNQLLLIFHVKITGEIKLGQELADIKRIHPDNLAAWPKGTGLGVKDWLIRRNK